MTNCPECDAKVEKHGMVLGEVFPCPDCGTDLEVLGNAPFAVQPAPKEAEDWGE